MHCGTRISAELGIEHVAKTDTDTVPFLDWFFNWINLQHGLPASPHNENVMVGNPGDEHWWWQKDEKECPLTDEQMAQEEFLRNSVQTLFVFTHKDNAT